MDGQITIFDFFSQEKKAEQKGDCGSCEWMYYKHLNGEGQRSCEWHGGHDGCHYQKRRICRTCGHMQRSVSGIGEIYHGFGCFGFGVSKSQNINAKACGDYIPATDAETWRTDDEAVEEWRGHDA